MWKQGTVAPNYRKLLTEFEPCKYVVLNVETASKTKNSTRNISFIIYLKRQLNTQVLGLGYPQGEQTLSQAFVPILSNT